MSQLLNGIIILLILVACGLILFIRISVRRRVLSTDTIPKDWMNEEAIFKFVKDSINDMLRTNIYDLGLSRDEFERHNNKRKQLRKALKECTHGDINSKRYVIAFIADLLENKYLLNAENIDAVIPFDEHDRLDVQNKFEILLYKYKSRFGGNALSTLIDRYGLAEEKCLIEEGTVSSYVITSEEIEKVYYIEHENLTLSFEDKIGILAQRVYQKYKGFGVIDELRDMVVDGVSGGVSGYPADFLDKIETIDDYKHKLSRGIGQAHDSVWLFYKGKSIHLSFLTFGKPEELQRVCQNIYRYNNPGQLSESNGYMVNEMKDGSRVVVVRPPFAENWAFFVRKFDSVDIKEMGQLITDERSELPIELIMWIIKGCQVTAVTGEQGSGKTTLPLQ